VAARQRALFAGIETQKDPDPLGDYTVEFKLWWDIYPRKCKKRDAFKAFIQALHYITFDHLMARTRAIADSDKAKGPYCPHPASYLRGRRWEDNPNEWFDNRGRTGVTWNYKS